MDSRRTGIRNSDGEGRGCGCGIPVEVNIIEDERTGRGLIVGDVEKLLKCWPVREGISLAENEGFIRVTCAGSAALGIGIAGFGSLERSIGCADGLVSMDAVGDPGRGNCPGVSSKFEVERVDWDVLVYRSILEIKVSKKFIRSEGWIISYISCSWSRVSCLNASRMSGTLHLETSLPITPGRW